MGYACINLELNVTKNVKTHTARLSTIEKRGNAYISELILKNLNTLSKILKWNKRNGIKFFRVDSDLFPWMHRYEIHDLPDADDIEYHCLEIGDYAKKHDMRLTFHPGPFNVLCSNSDAVVEKTIRELNDHSKIFDLMGFEPSFNNKINIHVGGAYGEKQEALKRWAKNYYRLNESTRQRLCIENDDKPGLYSVKDLMQLHLMCNKELPITFDYFHHKFVPGDLTEQEALEMAISTWPKDIVPVTHYSESRREEFKKVITDIMESQNIASRDLAKWPVLQDAFDAYEKIKYQAHSDMITGTIDSYGHVIDVMVEAKYKEKALEGYFNKERVKQILSENYAELEENF